MLASNKCNAENAKMMIGQGDFFRKKFSPLCAISLSNRTFISTNDQLRKNTNKNSGGSADRIKIQWKSLMSREVSFRLTPLKKNQLKEKK